MRNATSRAAAVAAVAVIMLGSGAAAWSFWSAPGTGAGSTTVAGLTAPSSVSASPSGGTVALAWTGHAGPHGGPVDGYYIERSVGAASGTCASSPSALLPAAPTSCSDTGVASGTYTYTVVAVFRSWTARATSSPVRVSAVDRFQVTTPAGVTVGSAFNVTVTAQDASNATATDYTGARALSWSGPGAAPNGSTPAYPASVNFTNGVGTASITLVKAETTTLVATAGPVTGTSGSIAVAAGPATSFAAAAASPQVAGSAFNVNVTARDSYNNTASSYTGAKALVWSGPRSSPTTAPPTYPASVEFAGGAGTATVTLTRAESTTLTVAQGAMSGTSSPIVVNAGAASRLAWTEVVVDGGTLSSPCLFTCTNKGLGNFGTFTARVSVTDQSGNTVSGLASATNVTVSTPVPPTAGSGGSFTSPTSGTSVTLTINPSGPASSTTTFTFKAGNGNWDSHTFTAAASGYANATATVTKL